MAPQQTLPFPIMDLRLEFRGNEADRHRLDLYDGAHALLGLHRSLAIVTHAVLHGEIITQAPSLKNARILSAPPKSGSWEVVVTILGLAGGATTAVVGGAFALATASRDSPLGHLLYSAYDYVVKSTLGFHVDYEKSLGQQYEEYRAKLAQQGLGRDAYPPQLRDSQLDSIAEKVEPPLIDMHRPITASETAESALMVADIAHATYRLGPTLNQSTYEYANYTVRTEGIQDYVGRVSSYNVNTFRGRIYLQDEFRPVPFELVADARNELAVRLLAASLEAYARDTESPLSFIEIDAIEFRSRTGRLKFLRVVAVAPVTSASFR